MRIAYFSPLPPQATGIAEYSINLLPHLARLAHLTVFTDEASKVNPAPYLSFPARDTGSFDGPLREGFDMCLYQMGNNIAFHESIYKMLLRYPGITVLHDLNLNSFFGEMLMKRKRVAAYNREMAYAYSIAGARHARQAQRGLDTFDIQHYPLIDRIGHVSLGVIVHSQYAQRLVVDRCPNTPVAHIHQPVSLTSYPEKAKEAKSRLGFQPNDLLVTSFGYVAPNKRIDVALKAFAQVCRSVPNLHYAVVGKVIAGYSLAGLLDELKLTDRVHLLDYVDDPTFKTWLRATDIGINLRYPTLGETSATLLALMATGKPTLVSRVDAFVELPDTACIKIEVGPKEQTQIETALLTLIQDHALRRRIGAAAADYVRRNCDPERIAVDYVTFIRQVVDNL